MAFDATDPAPLERFFRDLPTTIDHVMVTTGRPHYGRLVDLDFAQARRLLDKHLLLVLQVARHAHKVRPGGTLRRRRAAVRRRLAKEASISSIDRSNENSTQIPGVSSWTHFKLDRRIPAGRGSDGFGYRFVLPHRLEAAWQK